MISLLDANMLIALFDAAHVHHEAAHQWLAANRASGWATCPLTENACIRVISQPSYSGRLSVADIAGRLERAIAAMDHHAWPVDIHLSDSQLFDHTQIHHPKHLTDIYLLALAVHHQGRLVTFDQGISAVAVKGAESHHLLVL
jgi:toxin-antitoxin system PIN domain toxin